jgi:16S rRNA G966 N2-methylase RsmD
MFNKDFYPTPDDVIESMLRHEEITGKTILEPSAGSGKIVEYLKLAGAGKVIACELNDDLRKIVESKCDVIESNFLHVKSEQVSHVNMIIMNPPFSSGARHILHAYEIAPAGCKIISLCNIATIVNDDRRERSELANVIEMHGYYEDMGNCFSNADRQTDVQVALVKLTKPGGSYEQEFEGFFMFDEEEKGSNGIMPYNFIRDLVNRYIAAIKLYDSQMEVAYQIKELTSMFYNNRSEYDYSDEKEQERLRMMHSDESRIQFVREHRETFKKELQKDAWKFIFNKMDLTKVATRQLRDDINKFVETQQKIPFTMRNIYRMLEIVIGTTDQRMDKAILQAFDSITKHHDCNRHCVEGWKTNSHYLVGKKFIFPYVIDKWFIDYRDGIKINYNDQDMISDIEKALCFLTGANWDEIVTLRVATYHTKAAFGQWHNSHFFRFKGFKKGSMHFEFISEDVWAMFNQRVAKLKGYPLFEAKEQTAYQNRQTGRAESRKRTASPSYKQPEEQLTLIED